MKLPLFLILALVVLLGFQVTSKSKYSRLVGDEKRLGTTMQFDEITLQDYNFVSFVASWCGVCITNNPKIKDLAKMFPQMQFIAINTFDDAAKVTTLPPYKFVLMDRGSKYGRKYGIYGVPQYFILDKNGKVILHIKGGIKDWQIKDYIMPLFDK
jgi:cytochrome c biogenesis protein CcmG, thiol:disulfide interchange protein DsbE